MVARRTTIPVVNLINQLLFVTSLGWLVMGASAIDLYDAMKASAKKDPSVVRGKGEPAPAAATAAAAGEELPVLDLTGLNEAMEAQNRAGQNLADQLEKGVLQRGDCPADTWEKWGEQCQLRQLSRPGEKLGDEGAMELAAAFAGGGCLTSGLNLPDNAIGPRGATALAQALSASQLGGLVLNQNPIGDEGLAALATAIGGGDTELRSVSFGETSISDDGVKELAAALALGKTELDGLGLADNMIGDAGAVALARALEKCKVRILNLPNNAIGDDGAEALAKALESGTSAITMMDLSPNKIGDKGAEALARALQIMKKRGDLKKMTNIYLHGNPIGEAGKRALRPFTDQKIIDWSAA